MKKYVIPISAACVVIALISVLIIVFSNYRVVLSTDNFKINKKTLDSYIELEKNKFIALWGKESHRTLMPSKLCVPNWKAVRSFSIMVQKGRP